MVPSRSLYIHSSWNVKRERSYCRRSSPVVHVRVPQLQVRRGFESSPRRSCSVRVNQCILERVMSDFELGIIKCELKSFSDGARQMLLLSFAPSRLPPRSSGELVKSLQQRRRSNAEDWNTHRRTSRSTTFPKYLTHCLTILADHFERYYVIGVPACE